MAAGGAGEGRGAVERQPRVVPRGCGRPRGGRGVGARRAWCASGIRGGGVGRGAWASVVGTHLYL